MGLRLQCDAEALDACRVVRFIEPHSRNADARVISLRDQSREEIEFTVPATTGSHKVLNRP
jgi:hypothetical protein